MPAATNTRSATSLDSILASLTQLLSQSNTSSNAESQLSRAKLALLHQNALMPNDQTPTSTLTTARSILEAGALLSIRQRDPQSFVKYYSQLQAFYDFSGLHAVPSQNRSKIVGLYLLLLLSQSDYAGFHTLLESLVVAEGAAAGAGKSVEDDPFIRYPIELERSLMEGSYDLVWRKTKGRDVPGEEYALFSDILVRTIRLEIASCATRSYPSLSIASAKNLLFLDSEGAVTEFAASQGWSIEDGRIYFPGIAADEKKEENNDKDVIENMIKYARDLEMIV